MSKFAKPKTVREEDIERVIMGADAVDDRADDRKPAPAAPPVEPPAAVEEVRFTMTLPPELAGRVDKARKAAGGLNRLGWIRVAIAEKLTRGGF